jgi:hypothetical protein
MNLAIRGITKASERDAGSCVVYSFCFIAGSEPEAVTALLDQMELGQEIAVPDPTDGDCILEVRRISTGFEIKRGCHGRYGTWRPAPTEEAYSWLLPGALHASQSNQSGVLTIYRKQ